MSKFAATAAVQDFGTPHLNQTVSGSVAVVALGLAAAIWIFGEKHTPRLMVLLVLTGMTGLVSTPVGQWLRSIVDWGNRALGSLTARWTGAAVSGLIAVLAVYVLLVRLLRQKTVDDWTLAAAAVAPLAVATIPGPLGHATYTALIGTAAVVGWPIGWALNVA
ncbi:MAG TPA: hypothetical protein VFW64_12350 [Pseudonocardiaceae bacterium]|nr:hypothetical protein [Pseudonocardiaceae bacterium]